MEESDENLRKKPTDPQIDSPNDDETKTVALNQGKSSIDAHHPKKIGQYVVRRVIASGGMGTVYEAMQENPRRPVAIKVVKGSDVSDSAVKRLQYEAQMLARLHHPGIAEIYEAGTYEERGDSFPYFAMEYIPNAKNLAEYAKSRQLSIEERIKLFIQVCDAVNYGHQKGIVHRDLKPDNILVDSRNRVKVIDFGLAHATDSDLRHTKAQTEVGQIVGSLQYMSPEQFEGDSRDLDTRSDVYSLGVVLFELLSGSLPYDLNSKGVYEVARIIREKQPGTLRKIGIKVAAEIDIILQKCLRKEREMRYQSAFGLQQDLSRFLSGDAIVARSPSLAYQIRIFTRKNKLLVGSVATAFVLLMVGVIASTSLLVRVSEESEKANKANRFLASIFETAVPVGFGNPIPISQLLDKSSDMLEGAFPDDPDIEADINHSLGVGYFFCEEYHKAREHLNRALNVRREFLGQTHTKTKETLGQLYSLNLVVGDFENKLVVCEEICRIDSISYGVTHVNALSSKLDLAFALEDVGRTAEALKLVTQLREMNSKEGAENIKFSNQIDRYLSWFLLQTGQFEEAEIIAKKNFELASTRIEDGWFTASSKSYLAAALISQGKLDEAVKLYGDFPTYPALGKEFDIQGNLDPDASELLLVIFWEAWCPFCDRKMRALEKLYRQYHNYGIDMVGVTQINQTSTVSKCEDFIERNNITFPIFKENGKAYDYFDVPGVPQARLIYKGKLIWESKVGSTQLISRHMLEGIVKALQPSKVSN